MAANKEKAASSAIEITLFTKSGGPLLPTLWHFQPNTPERRPRP